jgi:serine/threonine-protein kinase RsbT
MSNDATDDLIAALNPYFSAPIAKALLTSTMRRANLVPGTVDRGAVPIVVSALERTLPSYITDNTRRSECVLRLRRLSALAGGVRREESAREPVSVKSPLGVAPVVTTSTIINIRTHDDVVNASEVGRDIARRVGFSHVDQTKIATATSELARNVLLYASVGEVRIASIDAPRRGIELTAKDDGPGIADVALVMSGAYRSRTGMGMGLKGTKRLMDTFDIASSPGAGTNVVARKFVP